MSSIPPLKRLQAEDFRDQLGWIERLIAPINDFMERTTSALNKSLTIDENMAGAIKSIALDGSFPVRMVWDRPARPQAVIVGSWSRNSGALSFTRTIDVGSPILEGSTLLSVDSLTGIRPGMLVTGTNIPSDTRVTSVTGTGTVGIDRGVTGGTIADGASVTFSHSSPVSVQWSFNQNGQLQIDAVYGIYPTPDDKYTLKLVCLS